MPFHVYLSPIMASAPAAQVQADARANPGERLLDPPPPAPGTEARLTTDPTGVVAHCDALQPELAKQGLTVVRKVVSQNPKYGVIWRADVTSSAEGGAESRLICWRGRDGFSFFDHPLQMLDPAESIPPLGQ